MTTSTATAGRLEPMQTVREIGQFAVVIHRFRKHRLATISFFIMIAILLTAFFAPIIAPYGRT